MSPETKKRVIYSLLLALPPLVVVAYAAFLLWMTWPVQELSVVNAGVFGDSFGVLNALFSGLAFAGVIVTILLQKNELELQRQELRESREQFKRSASAQERTARIGALSTLLIEYKEQISKNEHALKNDVYYGETSVIECLQRETEELIKKKNETVKVLEDTLHKAEDCSGEK